MRVFSALKCLVRRQGKLNAEESRQLNDYLFFKEMYWVDEEIKAMSAISPLHLGKPTINKIEERRMTEIRIVYDKQRDWVCDWGKENENEVDPNRPCGRPAAKWEVDGIVVCWLCKEHGEGALRAIEAGRSCITITGGYDEPKSNIEGMRHKFLHHREGIADSLMLHHAIVDIFNYLRKKEQADDSS